MTTVAATTGAITVAAATEATTERNWGRSDANF